MKLCKWLMLLVGTVFVANSACVSHILPYKPKRRDYQLPAEAAQQSTSSQAGSLWAAHQNSNYFFSDQRALLVNDVVTVRI